VQKETLMKITKKKLERIISEEIESVLEIFGQMDKSPARRQVEAFARENGIDIEDCLCAERLSEEESNQAEAMQIKALNSDDADRQDYICGDCTHRRDGAHRPSLEGKTPCRGMRELVRRDVFLLDKLGRKVPKEKRTSGPALGM